MNEDTLHGLDAMPAAERKGGPALKVAFWTLGCRLNQYDTEGIKSAMAARYAIDVVPWRERADLYVLNSCTVTSKADQECRRLARQVKRRAPESRVVVAGCYAQTQPDALAAIPEIDGVIGNTAKEDISTWLPRLLGDGEQLVAVQEFAEHPVFDSPLVDDFSGRSRAFVKIQDGCDLRCSYCLIWKARGPGRSRSLDDVLAQLARLVDAGFNEAILAGIHLGGYGRDLKPRVLLPDLLRRCLAGFPGLRIRLSSIHPNEVTPELLELFGAEPRLRPHLHISLQSGSDGVLKRMRRPYRSDRAWEAIAATAGVAPRFGIGADLIVGFPGETDAEFEETRAMVEALPFSYLHVFRFSPRPGTVAADLADPVHPETITRRSEILRELAERKGHAFREGMVGLTCEAVVESASSEAGWREATTDNYLSIRVPGRLEAGTVVDVRIERHDGDRLYGVIAGE